MPLWYNFADFLLSRRFIYILYCVYIYVYISNTDGNFAHLCVNILFSFSLLAHRKYFQHLLIYEKAKEKLPLLCFSFSSFYCFCCCCCSPSIYFWLWHKYTIYSMLNFICRYYKASIMGKVVRLFHLNSNSKHHRKLFSRADLFSLELYINVGKYFC